MAITTTTAIVVIIVSTTLNLHHGWLTWVVRLSVLGLVGVALLPSPLRANDQMHHSATQLEKSTWVPPRYGHYFHMGVNAQRSLVIIDHHTPKFRIRQKMDLVGVHIHYSYQMILTKQLSYVVGTGTELTAPSSWLAGRTPISIPVNYIIPSIWLGLTIHTRSAFNLWLGAEYALRWFYPLRYSEDEATAVWQQVERHEVGLKTDDYELVAYGHYFVSPHQAWFVSIAQEWLGYRPYSYLTDDAHRSPLTQLTFTMNSWKLSCGWLIHL